MNDKIIGKISAEQKLEGSISNNAPSLNGKLNYGNYELNKDYNKLVNKPQIEGVELQGNKTLEDLGINNKFNKLVEENNLENTKITNEEILSIFRR